MSRPKKYPDELVARGVRLALESDRPIAHIAADLGMHPETLRKKVRQAEADSGMRADMLTSEEREEIRKLESHLTRSRLTLDEQGWEELADALTKLVSQADRIHEESKKRLRRANHEGERHSTLVMMLFEGIPAMDAPPATDGADEKESGAVPPERKRRPVPQAAG